MMLKLLEDIPCIDLTCDVEMQGFYKNLECSNRTVWFFASILNKINFLH